VNKSGLTKMEVYLRCAVW